MLKVVIVALCFVGLALAATPKGEVGFEICDSLGIATVNEFHVTDCDDGSTHCNFVKGQSYTFALHATVHDDHPVSNSLPFKVVVRILGLPITLAEGDACDTAACPINPGEDVVFELTREIPANLPSFNDLAVSARVWGNVEGDNDAASTCASIRVSIVDAVEP